MGQSLRTWTMVLLLLLGGAARARAATPGAYVRINQLGYEVGKTGHAWLASLGPATGGTLTLRDASGAAVFSAPVGAPTGRWGAYTITPLDFPLARRGTYQVTVEGAVSTASPAFVAGNPAALYSRALDNILSFYRNERDGQDFIPSPLRTAPGHLNDAAATVYTTPPLTPDDLVIGSLEPTGEVIDASGGWWDAGDYMKYVETVSYTVGVMLTGLRDFPAQMAVGGPADFTAEARFGVGWLLKMWNDQSRTLYYEVGLSQDFVGRPTVSDYDIWRLPQIDDSLMAGNPDYALINHRPVFEAGPAASPISPNLAGRMAAAFALCFIEYRKTDLPFARRCLTSAEHIFDLADINPKGLLTILPFDGYPEVEWRDDLEWGATELDIAVTLAGPALPAGLPHPDAGYYLGRAAGWAHAYITGPNDGTDTLNLYDVSGLAHFDLHRAIDLAGRPSGLAVSQGDLEADLLEQLTTATDQAKIDPFGYGAFWTSSDSAAYGVGLSVMADEYASLTAAGPWDDLARRWMANVLGGNIWGASFIVGDGENFTDCLSHQVANLRGSLTGSGLVLKGAVVEGPIATIATSSGFVPGMKVCPVDGVDIYKRFIGDGARFWDNQQNYANTEPALDLTALSPLMFAWRIAGQPRPLSDD